MARYWDKVTLSWHEFRKNVQLPDFSGSFSALGGLCRRLFVGRHGLRRGRGIVLIAVQVLDGFLRVGG